MTEKCKVHLYSNAKVEVMGEEVFAFYLCVICKSAHVESLGFVPNPIAWTQNPDFAQSAKPEIPPYENYLAEIRCAQLDFLSPLCDWSNHNFRGDSKAWAVQRTARRLWERVMEHQTHFENAYCYK